MIGSVFDRMVRMTMWMLGLDRTARIAPANAPLVTPDSIGADSRVHTCHMYGWTGLPRCECDHCRDKRAAEVEKACEYFYLEAGE